MLIIEQYTLLFVSANNKVISYTSVWWCEVYSNHQTEISPQMGQPKITQFKWTFQFQSDFYQINVVG